MYALKLTAHNERIMGNQPLSSLFSIWFHSCLVDIACRLLPPSSTSLYLHVGQHTFLDFLFAYDVFFIFREHILSLLNTEIHSGGGRRPPKHIWIVIIGRGNTWTVIELLSMFFWLESKFSVINLSLIGHWKSVDLGHLCFNMLMQCLNMDD